MNVTNETDSEADERVSWDYRSRHYKAVHTRGGRIAHLCFIPNTGDHDRFLPLADLRLVDPSKDGRELILEFSNISVLINGRNLRHAANDIAIGRIAALEAFDPDHRDSPDTDTIHAPFIESIRFMVPDKSDRAIEVPKQARA